MDTEKEDAEREGREPIDIENGQEPECRALWAAVLVQACIDARSRSKSAKAARWKAEALAWLGNASNHRDFETVCDLAGVDPRETRRVLKEMIHDGEGVDFHCVRKARPHQRRRRNQSTNQGENDDKQQSTDQDSPRGKRSRGHLGQRGGG
ncbi:MAG: hypothetical protein CMO55_16910 [Verrucomicrobiales bacterium]|nr:hypothetical protein [Verrucomicrobiales bacterium]